MLRMVVLLQMLMIANPLFAFKNDNGVNVIAIEYPPFTTSSHPKGGIAFELLNDLTSNKKIKWKPLFLPPNRAYKILESGDWCASFYPISGQNKFTKYKLGKASIKLGLVRLSKPTPFIWSSLDELKGNVVVLLRTDSKSKFSIKFKNSGMNIVYVETIQAAIKMVLAQRVDIAMIDNISYSNLKSTDKKQLQLSKSFLHETKISIFINDSCDIPLLNLEILDTKE